MKKFMWDEFLKLGTEVLFYLIQDGNYIDDTLKIKYESLDNDFCFQEAVDEVFYSDTSTCDMFYDDLEYEHIKDFTYDSHRCSRNACCNPIGWYVLSRAEIDMLIKRLSLCKWYDE